MNRNQIATVGELIAALDRHEPTTPVRLATQPGDPIAHALGQVVCTPEDAEGDGTPRTEPPVVSLGEGEQVGYLPGLAGLAERAVHAARAYRAADPDGFHHRHNTPDHWNRWARRARVARTVAAALQVPVDAVLVTDDPHRTYRTRTASVPGDLITVTDEATRRAWRFIPDFATPGDGWLLLDRCPECEAEIPAIRVATLADLGEYLDLDDGDIWPADEACDAAIHQPGCAFGVPD